MEVCTVYDGIVYIVKKCINIFSKRGFLNVGTMLPRVGNIVPPPPTQMLSYSSYASGERESSMEQTFKYLQK